MIEDWKVTYNDEAVAQVLTFLPKQEGTKIVNQLYDGSYQIQSVGYTRRKAEVTIFVESRKALESMETAAATAALVSVRYREKTYRGYISDEINWSAAIPGQYYSGSFTLLIDEVS